MRFARTNSLALLSVLLLFLTLSLEGPALSQQSDPASPRSSPPALALLQQSLAVLTGGQPITDVTLTGTARRIAGSDDESGTTTLKALPGTGSRLDLSLPSGNRSEVRNDSGGTRTGSWFGPDGVARPIAYHNLLTDIGVFPAFTIAGFTKSANLTATYVGPETRDGQPVQHISASHAPGVLNPPNISLAALTRVDFFLDSTTLLPAAVTFNTHAENDAGLDIPVEIRFSNYTAVNGVQVPMHVQEFLNGGALFLDIQFQSATFNTGLTDSQFALE